MSAFTDLDRRVLLAGLAGSLAAPAVLRAQTAPSPPFTLGIASGDPAPDGFVIWTRLAPDPLAPHSGMRMRPETVGWEVSTDDGFRQVVATGQALARPELGHSVHVELAGLQPNRPYWYRFTAMGARSGAGRGRTLPAPGADLDRVRFIAGGCQNYEDGLYTAYRKIAEEPDVDFFWHYGDYIYEGTGMGPPHLSHGAMPVRRHWADEPYSLDDFRARYAQYKLDPDLQAAHAAHPWWVTWDDHEIDNNWASRFDQDGTPPDVFDLRRQAAAQAYYENMPLRARSFPHGTAIQIYREASYGRLLDAWFLDTRQFRDDQPCGDNSKPVCAEALRPDRTIMGASEEHWLYDGLASGRARWNLIGNQVMMMPLDRRRAGGTEPVWNMDSWAGYPAARRRLLDHLRDGRIGNVVVVTGDEHQNFAGELRDGGATGPALATEFVTTSVSSGGDGEDLRPDNRAILLDNPHVPFINSQRGYTVHEVTPKLWKADYRVVDQIRRPGGRLSTRKSFAVEPGAPGLHPA